MAGIDRIGQKFSGDGSGELNIVYPSKPVLDFGYVKLIERWGSDEAIIEAARMSSGKGFIGWPEDEKLLSYLYTNKHTSPFEQAGMRIEVSAPIMVFREWMRHRTQCLHPNTLIYFNAPKSTKNRHCVYKLRIEDIWKKWQPTIRRTRPERQTNALFPRSRIRAMHLRQLNEETNEFQYSNIINVIKGEPKPMVQITTSLGKTISLTLEHRVLTDTGWKTLQEAITEKSLLVMEGTQRQFKEIEVVAQVSKSIEHWKPVVEWEGVYEVSSLGRVRRVGQPPKTPTLASNGYLVVSLTYKTLAATRTIHSLVLEAFEGPRPLGYEARHLNNISIDNRLENLKWGTPSENANDRLIADRQQRLVPTYDSIVKVEDIGSHPTYDLSVTGPFHNFIADGFVVHNSYNEMSGRYTQLPDIHYVPKLSRVRRQSKENKQGTSEEELSPEIVNEFLERIKDEQKRIYETYQWAIEKGIAKEIARINTPISRYSRMVASANLKNWLDFLRLRLAPNAQYEIRMYAQRVAEYIEELFPRTYKLFKGENENA